MVIDNFIKISNANFKAYVLIESCQLYAWIGGKEMHVWTSLHMHCLLGLQDFYPDASFRCRESYKL